jgi:putative FmdB family regulatory protein
MPIYEYICPTCGHEEEVLQPLDAPNIKCSKESKGYFCNTEMKKKISNIAPPVFKGSGFYETDYKKKGFSKPDKKVEKSKGKENEGNKKKQK